MVTVKRNGSAKRSDRSAHAAANPTLTIVARTIVALAIRQAEYIADQLKAGGI